MQDSTPKRLVYRDGILELKSHQRRGRIFYVLIWKFMLEECLYAYRAHRDSLWNVNKYEWICFMIAFDGVYNGWWLKKINIK